MKTTLQVIMVWMVMSLPGFTLRGSDAFCEPMSDHSIQKIESKIIRKNRIDKDSCKVEFTHVVRIIRNDFLDRTHYDSLIIYESLAQGIESKRKVKKTMITLVFVNGELLGQATSQGDYIIEGELASQFTDINAQMFGQLLSKGIKWAYSISTIRFFIFSILTILSWFLFRAVV
jgi:hypothetical protein